MKPPATQPLDCGFTEVIQLIATARQRALQAVNTTLIDLYWQVGAIISRKIAAAEWGDGVATQLAAHIARTQPGLRGFTRPNLFRMRQFYEAYQGDEKVSALLRQLPWTHNLIILSQSKRPEEREFYAFLSQMFDYGNTAIEKRAIFFKRLLPLLDFGREREGVDLSKVTLTHHKLKDQGKRHLALNEDAGDYKLQPLTETGGGEVQEKAKALLSEIVAKVNDLFDGELTDDDKLVYVNNVLKGKLLESEILVQQAMSNTKGQFANSPDLANELMNAIMDAFAAHSSMSKQALDSERVRSGLKDILLGPAQLYEALRARGGDSLSA